MSLSSIFQSLKLEKLSSRLKNENVTLIPKKNSFQATPIPKKKLIDADCKP